VTATLEGVRGQRHALAAFYRRERPGTYFTGGWVGPRACLDKCGKSRLHRDSIPRPANLLASRYTDYAIRPTPSSGEVSYKRLTNTSPYVRSNFIVSDISLICNYLGASALDAVGSDTDMCNGCAVSLNPLNSELNPICYLLALLAHHFLHDIGIFLFTLISNHKTSLHHFLSANVLSQLAVV
jgi:hypothetical protein